MITNDYTFTSGEVAANLRMLAAEYEKISAGKKDGFACNVAQAAAFLKAAEVLISEMPQWVSVDQRVPDFNEPVLISWKGCMMAGIGWLAETEVWHDIEGQLPRVVTHWQPLPETPRE